MNAYKKYSTSLVIRKTQIKILKRYKFALTRESTKKRKRQAIAKCWHGCGKIRTIIHYWWNY